MKTVCDLDKCNGCMACIDKCPQKCINIKDSMNSYNAIIDEKKCINCKVCEKICPNVTKIKKTKPISWYQGWAKKEIREMSASGGFASAIIRQFIKNGGYVASCVYENGKFIFYLTNNLEEAKKFAGSKYVKSNPDGIYREIESKINNNKVLFIGLPCQVAAVKNRLKNHENLFTIDLICHGTPSPKILEKYLKEKNIDMKSIENIQFRNKTDFGLIINGKKIVMSRIIDEYSCAFLNALNYTENCYFCNYATIERISDITLGDSWGSDLKSEEKNGISLMLIQNEKGMELIENIELNLKNVNVENAIKNNEQLVSSSKLTYKREKFFKLIEEGKSVKYTIWKLLPKLIIKQKIKYILIKLHLK